MSNASLLVVGCGDIGTRVGRICRQKGWRIDAIRRTPEGLDGEINWHAADYVEPGSLSLVEPLCPDFVLATFNPTSRDIEGYQRGFTAAAANLLEGLGEHRVRRLIMVSSTRVYAEKSGGWVDESSELSGTDERALAIINAERQFLNSEQPSSVVRFAGVYGAPNGRLASRIAAGSISPSDPLRYTNRIHREDCAGFLAHLLAQSHRDQPLAPVYNGVDNEPAPAHQVEAWIADAMDASPAADGSYIPPLMSSHKRCRNQLLCSSGYELRYPDYRVGYSHVLGMR